MKFSFRGICHGAISSRFSAARQRRGHLKPVKIDRCTLGEGSAGLRGRLRHADSEALRERCASRFRHSAATFENELSVR
jgi:hypothetical protein